MKIQISNFHKNIMGTMSFDGLFPGMRKASDFSVYPISESTDKTIRCQSGNRWLEINAETGECAITTSASGHHNSWLLVLQKARGQHKAFTLSPVDLQALKMHIFTTAGSKVGKSFVYSDNSGASAII
jgi:hypothetical protein